jgi:glycine/D-amino acid oxidase-like deaminating enzyme
LGIATANVVICGAGIAGVSAAYQLAVRQRIKDVVIVEQGAPLSLTSDKSTECYRNWWPGPGDAMVGLMNRSIDILEDLANESGNIFHMNRRGYLYAAADPHRVAEMQRAGEEAARLGAGPLRCHPGAAADYAPASARGHASPLDGSDLLLDRDLIRRHFPYLAENTVAVLHARRCGWLSAQTLGMYLLDQARERGGVRLVSTPIVGVETDGGRVQGVRLGDGTRIATPNLVIAAGPLIRPVAGMLGITLPVFNELHLKVAFRDDAGAFPRDAPLLIWTDPQVLPWSEEERALFAESEETRHLLDEFPAGVHARAEGSTFLVLWTYHTEHVEPVWPLPLDPHYPEIVLRGLATMLPSLKTYFGRTPRPVVDGGYYCKTQENRPLICPLPVDGAYLIGALSGYGIMASCAAGELLAARVMGGTLPHYAPAFSLERYQDSEYQASLASWGSSGQL